MKCNNVYKYFEIVNVTAGVGLVVNFFIRKPSKIPQIYRYSSKFYVISVWRNEIEFNTNTTSVVRCVLNSRLT